jgi:hypothetical protein
MMQTKLLSELAELTVQLIPVIVGALLGFGSAWGLWAVQQHRNDAAVREQVLGLLRDVESIARGFRDNGVAIDQSWVTFDLLAERVFSGDGASALRNVRVGARSAYDLVSEVLQSRASLQYLGKEILSLGEAMRLGHYYQTGPIRMTALKTELGTISGQCADTSKNLRHELGDDSDVANIVPAAIPPPNANRI